MKLRHLGFRVEMGLPSADLGDHLKKANKMGATYAVIRGSDEARDDRWTLKSMDSKKQETVSQVELMKILLREAKGLSTL